MKLNLFKHRVCRLPDTRLWMFAFRSHQGTTVKGTRQLPQVTQFVRATTMKKFSNMCFVIPYKALKCVEKTPNSHCVVAGRS